MGIKKFFKLKPPGELPAEENKERLMELGIPVKTIRRNPKDKFVNYSKYAADKMSKRQYLPSEYQIQEQGKHTESSDLESLNKADFDPYSAAKPSSTKIAVDPYLVASTDNNTGYLGAKNSYLYDTRNNYSSYSNSCTSHVNVDNSSNPYASMKDDDYRVRVPPSNLVGYRSQISEANYDFKHTYEQRQKIDDDSDLNNTVMKTLGDDLNRSIHDEFNENELPDKGFRTFEDIRRQQVLQEQQEMDEEVDEIKQQIKLTKQASVTATRSTLKMAQEAQIAGQNSLGMLGNQSEKLNNVEQNLYLIKTQNRAAEDNVAELKKLDRNILAVHVGNPFTSRRKTREAEERIKIRRMLDSREREELNSNFLKSTSRIENAIRLSESDGFEKYQRESTLKRDNKFQFEQDVEDDEMELEIDRNLDRIGEISSNLKKLALAAGEEIKSQKNRIQEIEETADDLDVRIHVNTTKLANAR